ncbi:sulfurtransferase TusA family protein [Anoxybacillus sp. B7M1]|jgi:tRNA 2-thiouridine synthesizing protein A|uniref:sulfurtransferase TusA family protein n=1 Tax=unclassified Anoxybacillus TaxID=2639704 RepID=UPI0005CD1651|nr:MULTISPECIES: sulfurtransferase TusA family protein [unclassified Anoxybacillus]ANB55703.1 sulfurtransferase TusA family protein [Anoxybacillus sp. B2M1]ANB63464.1 sulfurtransferase TusA family protein [Anoxybacillus sp. B7M1]
MNIAKVVDAKGLSCPMPLVKSKKAIDQLASGEVVEVKTTDKGAKKDLAAWAQASGHQLVDMKEENGVFTFWIKKA